MTTEQLKYFVSIAENGSYSITAREMNISQSSVSKQIRTFEWELGCVLFDRGSRHVKLTAAGGKLYPMLKKLLEQYEAVIREAHGYKISRNVIRLVSLPIMGQYGITEALRLFETERANIQIDIIEQEERDILESLARGDCDMAIIREEILPAGVYKTVRLTEDRLALFVHEKHPYADCKEVSPEMLGNESLMFMPKHTSIYQMCGRLCKKYNINPNVISCARIETILSNVEAGRCSALLMAKTIQAFRPANIRVIPVSPPWVSGVTAVYTGSGEQKPPVQDFVVSLTRYFAAEIRARQY